MAEQELGFRVLERNHPNSGRRLRHLFATSSQSRDICEDYGAAALATKNWVGSPEIADKFRCIAAELEMEIVEILKPPGSSARE